MDKLFLLLSFGLVSQNALARGGGDFFGLSVIAVIGVTLIFYFIGAKLFPHISSSVLGTIGFIVGMLIFLKLLG